MTILFIQSHYGPLPPVFTDFAAGGRVTIIRDSELTDDDINQADGLITTTHLDQIGFLGHREALAHLFAREGRLFFNGHILKPFVEGLQTYRPMLSKRLSDFKLTRIAPHPIFDNFEPADMATRKGVAGFYGRGHNPMPKGAQAINGIGALKQPIDWQWDLPDGGHIFSHAGNDLWAQAPEDSAGPKAFAERILLWAEGKLEEALA